MKNTTSRKTKKKKTIRPKGAPKVSPHVKPSDKTLEEWQIALRCQAAANSRMGIGKRRGEPNVYDVTNTETGNVYKVVYCGKGNEWNYCSCMDFRTSRLGTCKHIEGVGQWVEKNHKRVSRALPAYSSVYMSYRGEPALRLRLGTNENAARIAELSRQAFDEEGWFIPGKYREAMEFIAQASALDDTFRCYSDAMEYLCAKVDYKERQKVLPELTDDYLDSLLKTRLYPYQKAGIRFAFSAGRSIIADEMGLGKTVQAIGVAELLLQRGYVRSVLIVCPTSLKYQWKREIEKFTDSTVTVVEGNHLKRREQYRDDSQYKIVSYHAMSNDVKVLKELRTDMLIMDEVQRLKNWDTQISRSARKIKSEFSVVLSGTPLENKLQELYSIMQFVDQYLLGPYYQFMHDSAVMSDTGKIVGYRNLNDIGERLKSVMLRRRKADVALQLPERVDQNIFVPMTKEQRAIHTELQFSVAQIVSKWNRFKFLSESDRRRMLLMMSQMRMVCDSTFILDQKSRHDTKVDEVMEILDSVLAGGDSKVVIFSQWERMTRLISMELDKLDIKYEYLHGGIPSAKRKALIDNFTDDPESRVFISTDAGSTGLNLQVASIIINVDLPWNPAVLEQRIARIHRIGQRRSIQVLNLVASGTIEERMLATLNFKTELFKGILDNGLDTVFLDNNRLDKIMETVNAEMSADVDSSDEDETVSSDEMETPGGDSGEPDVEDVTDFDEEISSDVEDIEAVETVSADESEEDETEAPHSEGNEETEESSSEEAESEESSEEESAGKTSGSKGSGATSTHAKTPQRPEELVNQGISFLSGLARTLKSPEKTRELVDTLIKTDSETGKTTLSIPVPDKETVETLLSVVGKLFAR